MTYYTLGDKFIAGGMAMYEFNEQFKKSVSKKKEKRWRDKRTLEILKEGVW